MKLPPRDRESPPHTGWRTFLDTVRAMWKHSRCLWCPSFVQVAYLWLMQLLLMQQEKQKYLHSLNARLIISIVMCWEYAWSLIILELKDWIMYEKQTTVTVTVYYWNMWEENHSRRFWLLRETGSFSESQNYFYGRIMQPNLVLVIALLMLITSFSYWLVHFAGSWAEGSVNPHLS